MDWDSDGDVDWVVISEANYYKVDAVNSKRLTVSSMKVGDEETQTNSDVETWKLDDLNDKKDYKVKVVAPEDLKEGDIIEVTYTFAYDKGEKAEVVTATVTKVEADTAELDKVSTKDTLELTFDGEVKKIAEANDKGDVVVPANPAKYEQFDDEELGTEFSLWMNRNGFIVYSDYATDSSNYLMVLDTGDGSDKTGDRKQATMDVLYADNSVKKDVKVVTDLKLDGYDKDSREWTESEVVGNVYKYWMNEDGVITKMEPMIEDVAEATKGDDYTYDQSSDRLKEGGNFIASLEEAKVIFAVTQHSTDKPNYIIRDEDGSLYVDDADVLAVKQADIPDIGTDPEAVELVSNNTGTWLGTNNDIKYIADVDKNGEASAAILGVENFNKFNDASTKVGLVTSVSYDKNDVVTVDVAYNGKVESISSKEKVDFDDVVEQYNKTTKKDEGLTTKEAATMLKNNAAYAEITTDADGKLTNVTFMDVDGNNAVGHYYEVSRRIVSKVKSGNVAYGNQSYYYYNDKNLYSVGRLEVSDKDLDKDVQYYSIDGRPTVHDKDSYKGEMLSVANGFDGNPDITAESDSNLIDSYVNNKFDDADTYYVADLASKIDGDIVAVYAFEDSLGETDKESDSIFVTETKKPVQNNDQKSAIAEVKSAQGGGAVSATDLKVFKDGKEVSDVTLTLDGKDLNVQAKATAVPGDYVAKFTVGKTEYKVEFKVVAADVTTVDSTAKVVAEGVAESTGSTPASYDAQVTTAAANDEKFAVRLTYTTQAGVEEEVTVEATADASSTAANTAQAIVDAISGQIDLKGLFTASVETTDHVKVAAKETSTVKSIDNLEVGGKTVLGTASKETSDYVAPVKGEATLTINAGINVTEAQTYQLKVDGVQVGENVTVTKDMDAAAIAQAIVAKCDGKGTYTVSANGAVVTVAQNAADTAAMVVTFVQA